MPWLSESASPEFGLASLTTRSSARAVRPRRHAVVDHQHVGLLLGHQRQRAVAVEGRSHDLMTLEPQVENGQFERVGVVVGDHHPHGSGWGGGGPT